MTRSSNVCDFDISAKSCRLKSPGMPCTLTSKPTTWLCMSRFLMLNIVDNPLCTARQHESYKMGLMLVSCSYALQRKRVCCTGSSWNQPACYISGWGAALLLLCCLLRWSLWKINYPRPSTISLVTNVVYLNILAILVRLVQISPSCSPIPWSQWWHPVFSTLSSSVLFFHMTS